MAYPLLGVSEQKPDGKMTDGYAEDAVDISRQVSMSTRSRDRSSGFSTSILPTEIYQMIVEHIVSHYDRRNDDHKAIRAKTLLSLTRTSTTLQYLTEPYLYSFPDDSRLESYQGKERFRLSLAVDSRRANHVQVLDFEWDTQVQSRRLIIDIARRCPNLRLLGLRLPKKDSGGDEFNQAYVDHLADLFFVCPNVRKLRFTTYCRKVDLPIPEKNARVAKFAGQLSYVEMDGGGAWFQKAMLPYLSKNLISFNAIHTNSPQYEDLPGFLETLSQRCPVLQRLKIKCNGITLADLTTLCKALGSTLKLLCLDCLDGDGSVLSMLVPRLQVLEHLMLGNDISLHVQDLKAMSSLSCLRTFIADGMDYSYNYTGNFFRGETDTDVDRALASFIHAHRTTLETMWLHSDHRLDRGVFDNLKLVPNLGCVGLCLMEELERKDVDDLLEACPKLRGASDIDECLDDMFGDAVSLEGRRNLWIGYWRPTMWFEFDYPWSDTSWAVSLRQYHDEI